MKVTVIDYGAGNLFSIEKAFKRLGCGVIITNDLSKVKKSDKLVLPGVGHFGLGVQNIEKLKLKEIIYQKLEIDKIPILGICLGMQLLLDFSEEGNCNGLGLINMRAKKFDLADLKVPHMGWNQIDIKGTLPLFKGIDGESLFYFVHSYYVENVKSNKKITYGLTNYGHPFISAFCKENIYGVQFHPEKSHDQGLMLLENFKDI